MAWTIEYDAAALKDIKKLGRYAQKEIYDYIDNHIAECIDPRSFGKPLRRDIYGLWRYRVGDYRIVCKIQDKRVVILIVGVGHRSDVYD